MKLAPPVENHFHLWNLCLILNTKSATNNLQHSTSGKNMAVEKKSVTAITLPSKILSFRSDDSHKWGCIELNSQSLPLTEVLSPQDPRRFSPKLNKKIPTNWNQTRLAVAFFFLSDFYFFYSLCLFSHLLRKLFCIVALFSISFFSISVFFFMYKFVMCYENIIYLCTFMLNVLQNAWLLFSR